MNGLKCIYAMFTMKKLCFAQENFILKTGGSEQLRIKHEKRAYIVDCFNLTH